MSAVTSKETIFLYGFLTDLRDAMRCDELTRDLVPNSAVANLQAAVTLCSIASRFSKRRSVGVPGATPKAETPAQPW
mgnify:FL=1